MVFLNVDSTKTPRSAQLALVVEKPLPTHAYPDEFMDCTLRLQNSDQLPRPISFHVALVHADTKLTTETSSHLVVDPATPLTFTSDTCTFRFQLRHVVKNMCLRCYLPDPHHMVSVLTSAFTIVQEKLVVIEQPPDVWFKDEGGRDKCMTVYIQVQAAPGHAVTPRIIPLELSLLYDTGELVQASASATSPSSGILKLFPDLRPNITDGHVRLSFRYVCATMTSSMTMLHALCSIEDVSKNHQNHSFMLQIAPESSNVYADIASVRTAPMAIRSKRNKRRLAGLKSPSQAAASSSSPSSSTSRPRMLPTPVHATPTTGSVDKTPVASRRNTSTSTPHNLPRARPSWSDTMQEWKVFGYEIHPDGSTNKQAPIYRCMACMALSDASQQASHSPSCGYYRHRHAQNHNTPRPQQRVQTPHMVYGYNHAYTANASTPMATNNPHTPAASYTPSNSQNHPMQHHPNAYTPTHQQQQQHGFAKPEPNIFLTSAAKPQTPSPADATPKPMMMLDMYMNAAAQANSNWPMQVMAMSMDNNASQQQLFSHPQESCVAFILAIMQTDLRGDKMGLAAFDQYQQLIGFYKEHNQAVPMNQQQQQQRGQMVFSPLAEFPFCDPTTTVSALESALQYGAPSVFALSKYMGNLVKLQEEALMHYWSQNLMQ
ncbi:Aste57867_11742 [Aphanomyces stellatus]|uniref:Aste57867_11742 protein n=1 Tax=Aphanomyces stellatus TaxID=120398 RepID=A0A485KTT5_9STRA|nr:hypothetical protein As57867_011698 [Aphanomyces stellatus]VFT88598.1 Aste57867_11742 [Aphanomyces stellatus]